MKLGGKATQRVERYTVILVPEGVSRVRRFQLQRAVVMRTLALTTLAAVLLLAGLIDWARLRLDAVEVASLRAETVSQREEISRFSTELSQLEERLSRLTDFERKVRVIANLPNVAADHTHGGEAQVPGVGRGGDEAETLEVPPQDAPSFRRAPQQPIGGAPWEAWRPSSAPPRELVAVGHLRARARVLREVALMRESSLRALVQQLDGRSRQLAATPSIWPTAGWITSRFGNRISPFTGRRQFHAGLDIAAAFGTQVAAPGRGRVVFVGRKGALGRVIVIDHGWGIRTHYGHLAEARVRVGQQVERGERIGTVGSSGRSTGPHLHYGVEVAGRAVDPLDYVLE